LLIAEFQQPVYLRFARLSLQLKLHLLVLVKFLALKSRQTLFRCEQESANEGKEAETIKNVVAAKDKANRIEIPSIRVGNRDQLGRGFCPGPAFKARSSPARAGCGEVESTLASIALF